MEDTDNIAVDGIFCVVSSCIKFVFHVDFFEKQQNIIALEYS